MLIFFMAAMGLWRPAPHHKNQVLSPCWLTDEPHKLLTSLDRQVCGK